MHIFIYMCMCMCVSLCLLWGAVSRRVSSVVARYLLFVIRDWSFVVGCPSLCCALLSVFLRAVVVAGFWWLLECLRIPYPLPLCCFTCWLLAGSSGFLSLSLLALRPSHASMCPLKTSTCTFKTSPCVRSPRARVFQHVRVVLVHNVGMLTRN